MAKAGTTTDLMIERVPFETRIEKRLAALLSDLAVHKNMTVAEMLEEMGSAAVPVAPVGVSPTGTGGPPNTEW